MGKFIGGGRVDLKLINSIIKRLEDLKMYEAAIEVIRMTTKDESRIVRIRNQIKNSAEEINKEDNQIAFIKEKYFNGDNREGTNEIITVKYDFEGNNKKLFVQGINEFNKSNYSEALNIFNELSNNLNGLSKAFILTYISLCQYKMADFTAALRTVNNAISYEENNSNLYKIRDQIIERLEIVESKSRFVEEYYSTGTYMGEIVKHSIELYHRLDNIEVKNKNILKRIPAYFNEVKKLYAEQRRSLEKDLVNADELINNAEKNLSYFLENEEIKRMANSISRFGLSQDVAKVLRGAEILHLTENRDSELDYSYIVFSYCKSVEMLCREKLLKYFLLNRERMPLINERSDYHKLGITSYDANGIIRYSFAADYKIGASEYLIEINKHPSIRKQFNGKEHLMPWEKLKFINHCIRTGKDPIDGTKSAGMLILFYCVYNNYLAVKHEFQNKDEIIYLAGNLIRLQNERNLLMHSKVLENRFMIDKIREITLDCIDKLCKIE